MLQHLVDTAQSHVGVNNSAVTGDADETSPGVVKAIEESAKKNKLKVWYSPEQRCSMARIYLNA